MAWFELCDWTPDWASRPQRASLTKIEALKMCDIPWPQTAIIYLQMSVA